MFLISELRKILFIFTREDKKKLIFVSIIQIFLALLDLLGVALIGIIGAIAIYGIQSKPTGNRVESFLEFINLDLLNFQSQVAYLGAFAVFVFLFKTVASIFLTRKHYFL